MVLINNARAKRMGTIERTGTGAVVGPGSYNNHQCKSQTSLGVAEERNVPFDSISDRPNVVRQQSTMVMPGPGTYQVRRATSSPPVNSNTRFIASSASAFRARSPQISPAIGCPGSTEFVASTAKDNPGPGEYAVVGDLTRALQVKKDSSHGLSSISYSKSMPSIPPARDSKGFRFTGRDADKIGPADYDGTIPAQMSRTRSATDFHQSPSKRQMFAHNATIDNFMPNPEQPGPGDFLVMGELTKGTSSAFLCKVPQVPPMGGKSQDNPGPGTYEDDAIWTSEDKPLAFASVRSTSDRSQSWQHLSHPFTHPENVHRVPGPGTYPNPPGFNGSKIRRARGAADVLGGRKFHAIHQPQQVMSLRDTDGNKLWGFDCSDEKSCNKPNRDNGVPSLAYNIEDSMGQSLKSKLKEPMKLGKMGIFGSQAKRFHGGAFDPPAEISPGPGEHQNLDKRDGYHSLKGQPTVLSFKSGQHRLPPDPSRDKSMKPDPGTYEAFDKVNYRSKYRRAKNDHLSFGSSAGRWNPNEVFVGQKFTAIPGPGEYEGALPKGKVVGAAITTTTRNGENRDHRLGPGVYNVHGSTMHRMTYNVSGQEAAVRDQGFLNNVMEPPNVGGGSGGGIHGTRSRLGHLPGGSGNTSLQADEALWEEDRLRAEARASVFAKSSQKGWAAIQDNPSASAPVVGPMSTPIAAPSALKGSAKGTPLSASFKPQSPAASAAAKMATTAPGGWQSPGGVAAASPVASRSEVPVAPETPVPAAAVPEEAAAAPAEVRVLEPAEAAPVPQAAADPEPAAQATGVAEEAPLEAEAAGSAGAE